MNKVVLGIVLGGLAVGGVPPGSAQEGAGLRLTGVMMSGQASVAIIAGADGREKAYRLGQEIYSGATLAEVSAHGVVIARDRRREWLPLVGGAGAAGRLAASPPQVLPRAPEPTVGMATGTALAEPQERRSKFSPELARPGEMAPDGARVGQAQ